jgi:hypothetical protein
MPEISTFYGIYITMNPKDHNPPHFHATYGEHEALFGFDGKKLEGKFPRKQAKMVSVWAMLRNEELLNNWNLAKNGKHTFNIEPLK